MYPHVSLCLCYQGDDPTDPKFFIDDQGRILTSAATKRLDREEVSQYMLTVVATDLVGQKVCRAMKGLNILMRRSGVISGTSLLLGGHSIAKFRTTAMMKISG